MKKVLRSNLNNLQVDENIYLNRLKEQYKRLRKAKEKVNDTLRLKREYESVRLFCLDTQLLSFNEIELMEFEVILSFNLFTAKL